MSDFHLLFYLYGLDCFGTKMKTQMTSLLKAVDTKDKKLAEEFMKGDTWSTLEHLIGAHGGSE
jgi:NPL4 family